MTTRNDSKIQVFEHPQFGEIRVSGTSDEPLFCLADICKVLEISNPSMAKRNLKGGGLKVIEVGSFVTNQYGNTEIEQKSNLTFISEQNLYRLVMRSIKPQAEPFQDWVCGEVLPAIRKRGAYVLAREGDTEAWHAAAPTTSSTWAPTRFAPGCRSYGRRRDGSSYMK